MEIPKRKRSVWEVIKNKVDPDILFPVCFGVIFCSFVSCVVVCCTKQVAEENKWIGEGKHVQDVTITTPEGTYDVSTYEIIDWAHGKNSRGSSNKTIIFYYDGKRITSDNYKVEGR